VRRPTAVLLALLVSWGSAANARSKEPKQPITSADRLVLEAALADLLSYEGEESPRKLMTADASGRFAVAPDSTRSPLTTSALLERGIAKWEGLEPEEWRGFKEAATHLVKRVKRKEGFAGFQSAHPLLRGPHGKESDPTDPHRPIHAWPPGYSRNKALAVVQLSVPWSMHSADALYLVRKTETGWRIVRREFAVYP
jgi:hypothetical protein